MLQDRIPGLLWPLLLIFSASISAAPQKLIWKPVEVAVLKIDDRPVKLWEIFRAEKKPNLVLVQLGSRFLFLDTAARQLFELPPQSLERTGKELRMSYPQHAGNLQPTSDWSIRDAGRARIIRIRLPAEGRVLEIQLPIPLDLRTLY